MSCEQNWDPISAEVYFCNTPPFARCLFLRFQTPKFKRSWNADAAQTQIAIKINLFSIDSNSFRQQTPLKPTKSNAFRLQTIKLKICWAPDLENQAKLGPSLGNSIFVRVADMQTQAMLDLQTQDLLGPRLGNSSYFGVADVQTQSWNADAPTHVA